LESTIQCAKKLKRDYDEIMGRRLPSPDRIPEQAARKDVDMTLVASEGDDGRTVGNEPAAISDRCQKDPPTSIEPTPEEADMQALTTHFKEQRTRS
jgi:hypothetical protein